MCQKVRNKMSKCRTANDKKIVSISMSQALLDFSFCLSMAEAFNFAPPRKGLFMGERVLSR